jgi:chemotaxis signal transduction protein
MKNVIIFAVAGERYAIELRWVREIVTLGPVTPVPGAPSHVIGAVNIGGSIMPVLDLSMVHVANAAPNAAGRRAASRAGDSAVLVDIDGVTAAIQMTKVDEVSSAIESVEMPPEQMPSEVGAVRGAVTDSRGRSVPLIDPHELIRITLALAHGALVGHESAAGSRGVAPEDA